VARRTLRIALQFTTLTVPPRTRFVTGNPCSAKQRYEDIIGDFPSDQRQHARLGLVTRFLPAPLVAWAGSSCALTHPTLGVNDRRARGRLRSIVSMMDILPGGAPP